jgi:hypothetical protein
MPVIPVPEKREMRRIVIKGKHGQIESTSTNKDPGTVVHACHPSYTGDINRRIPIPAGLNINVRPYSKKFLKKRLGHILSDRALSQQAQGTKFKIQDLICVKPRV